jgi:hypothetical protein
MYTSITINRRNPVVACRPSGTLACHYGGDWPAGPAFIPETKGLFLQVFLHHRGQRITQTLLSAPALPDTLRA